MSRSLLSATTGAIALPTIEEVLDLLDKDATPFDLSVRDTATELFPARLGDLVEPQPRAA